MKRDYISIASNFRIEGEVEEIIPFGNGYINDTFLVKVVSKNSPGYLLQKINIDVFEDVESLMHNVQQVTSHIRSKLEAVNGADLDRQCLNLIPTRDEKTYFEVAKEYWRMFLFIADSTSHDKGDVVKAREGGRAFGEFNLLLSDLNPDDLKITIPNFHNLRKRLNDFLLLVTRNAQRRVGEVAQEIEEVKMRMKEMTIVDVKIGNDELPSRIVHCDTKLNNILFDSDGRVLCVVDLDTVMPGCILSDFGDAIRTFSNTGDEDDKNLSMVSMDIEIFQAFAKGFLEKVGDILTNTEINMLAFSAKYITYMQLVRFLSDYLNGDTHYKISYKEHNLVRARAQLALLKSMERQEEEMNNIIKRLLNPF